LHLNSYYTLEEFFKIWWKKLFRVC
jgi:hypothetical protein